MQRGNALDVDGPPATERDFFAAPGRRSQEVADLIIGPAEPIRGGELLERFRQRSGRGLYSCFGVVGSRAAKRVPSRALPRHLALWTNSNRAR